MYNESELLAQIPVGAWYVRGGGLIERREDGVPCVYRSWLAADTSAKHRFLQNPRVSFTVHENVPGGMQSEYKPQSND